VEGEGEEQNTHNQRAGRKEGTKGLKTETPTSDAAAYKGAG